MRRRVLLGGLVTVLTSACACGASAEATSGCWVPGSSAKSFMVGQESSDSVLSEVLVDRSGIDGLESALINTLDDLGRLFSVLPGFSFYRERNEPNAKATDYDFMRNRPDGTVIFGLKLIKQLLSMPEDGDAAIVAVCAHEFAHILSYNNGMYNELRPKGSSPFAAEQFADYMAGYYAGRRKLADQGFPAVVFADAVSGYGGTSHGDGGQRATAVEAGFLAAYTSKFEVARASRLALSFALGEL